MAVTEQELLQLLDEAGIQYELHEKTREPILLYHTFNYQNLNKQSVLMVVIQLSEDGEYIKFFTPSAYYIESDESSYAALKTFAIISWRVKMLDFELDGNDGEIRPTIDFPLEDGSLTCSQIIRCCQSIAKIIDVMDPFIRHAIVYGSVHPQLLDVDISKLILAHLVIRPSNEEEKNIVENEDVLIERLHSIQERRTEEDLDDNSMEEDSSESESNNNSEDDWI